MDKFSRFLEEGEEITWQAKKKQSLFRLFLVYGMVILCFFLLYPLFSLGRYGALLWLSMLAISIVLVIKVISDHQSVYLLTNYRLIFLKSIGRNYLILGFAFNLSELNKVIKIGSSIYLSTPKKDYKVKCHDQKTLIKILGQENRDHSVSEKA